VRKLFPTFARSWPGVGLLLLRVTAGMALVGNGAGMLRGGFPIETIIAYLAFAIGGLFLAIGLWTPAAGTFIAIIEIWRIVSHDGDRWINALIAVQCSALTLLGPGAWSVDARLFGWKRIDIRNRKR
jgi:putative oxidoreductase